MTDLTCTEARAAFKALIPATLVYTAVFVPWSQSRSAKPGKPELADLNLNWKVTFGSGRQSLTTDYSAGIAHIPGYKYTDRMCVDEFNALVRTCETGVLQPLPRAELPSPDVVDVLSCLCSDAEVINYGTFEDWASDTGYDVDSRSAEKTYKACLEISLKLRSILGNDLLVKLQELARQL